MHIYFRMGPSLQCFFGVVSQGKKMVDSREASLCRGPYTERARFICHVSYS